MMRCLKAESKLAKVMVPLSASSFPATTGRVSRGNHIQTKASLFFGSEVIIYRLFPAPDTLGEQSDFTLYQIKTGCKTLIALFKKVHPHQCSRFKYKPD